LDKSKNVYWLIELKDFSFTNPHQEVKIKQKTIDLVKKAVDSLCMFLSSKHSYPFAKAKINPCMRLSIPDDLTQFNFVTIIHCDQSQKADIMLINEQFRSRFKPYAELFGIKYYAVVEHSSATKFLPNNMVQ
jgi:hypothetical protein